MDIEVQTCAESYFDGNAFQYLGWFLLGTLLTLVTLGIGFPWAACMLYRWEAQHTYIGGNQLRFTGTGLQLLGVWLIIEVLSVFAVIFAVAFSAAKPAITVIAIAALASFGAWAWTYLKSWTIKHMVFANPSDLNSPPTNRQRIEKDDAERSHYIVLFGMGLAISILGLICLLVIPQWQTGAVIIAVGVVVLEVSAHQ